MPFSDLLNLYCEKIGCTNVALAVASGVDASTISRLRNKNRATRSNRQLVDKLCAGLILLASQADGFENPSEIEAKIKGSLIEEEKHAKETDYNISFNFNTILQELEISNIKLARYLCVDASWISRTRKGERRPTSRENFLDNFLEYLLKYHFEKMHREYYKKLIGDFPDEISHRIFKSRMTDWFMENHFTPKNSMYGFLEKVDRFHLENFLASKRIEGFIIPEGSPIQQNFKRYCGLEQMRQGILDFFNEVIYSNKTGNILLYSSINYEKLTKGDEFRKKILFALAMILKKGNQIHIIHHIERIDRSFIEMITEIETWIPLYMTGQIEPYYFVNKLPEELNHGLYVAPSVATYTMECIARMEENGLATLTKKSEERPYYEALGDYMLSAAKPLMKIYRHTAEDKYMEELEQEMKMAGDWKNLFQGPPVYTMNEAMFCKILSRSVMSEKQREKLTVQYKRLCILARNVLKNNKVTDMFPVYNEKEFNRNPISLQLAGLFSEEDLFYTFEEYTTHISMVKEYAKKLENYSCNIIEKIEYKNINVIIHEGGAVIVLKNKQPVIAFFVKQPLLCQAFQEFEKSILSAYQQSD